MKYLFGLYQQHEKHVQVVLATMTHGKMKHTAILPVLSQVNRKR